MMRQLSAEELEQAKLDPATVFDCPQDVLVAEDLTKQQKLAILKRWEMDADALLRAGDEGMTEGAESGELVRSVRAAIEVIESE